MFTSYYTIKQVSEIYPGLSESYLRYLIFNKETNGFGRCVIQKKRKILIDENELTKWLKESGETQ